MSEEFKFWLFVFIFLVLPVLQWILRRIQVAASKPRSRPQASRSPEPSEGSLRENRMSEDDDWREPEEWIEHEVDDEPFADADPFPERESRPAPAPLVRSSGPRTRTVRRQAVLGDLGSLLEEMSGGRIQATSPPPPPPPPPVPSRDADRRRSTAAAESIPLELQKTRGRRSARESLGSFLAPGSKPAAADLRAVLVWSEILAPPISLRTPTMGGGPPLPQAPRPRDR